ncbi:MAG: hypothetical protein GWO20_17280 [Candidatus Korarchaeota archaeon]|nr:hypothetical protein [Candidatus Korarchaeota archaeon]
MALSVHVDLAILRGAEELDNTAYRKAKQNSKPMENRIGYAVVSTKKCVLRKQP